MAIELGALTLAIRDQGGADVLATLKAVDTQAKKVGATNATPRFDPGLMKRAFGDLGNAKKGVDAVRASEQQLAREIAEGTKLFALQARTVDTASKAAVAELRASAAAQREWLVSVGASTEQQAKFAAATQILERRLQAADAAQARLARTAQRAANQVTVFGRHVTNAQGSIIGAGRASITALNAVAFAASQMAATGEASFRSLATALSSFAAFFGPTGAIVSLITTTGLALTDFFTRRQKEIAATAQRTIDETRRAMREVQLMTRQGDREGLTARAKGLFEGTVDAAGVVDLREQAAALDKQIGDKQAELTRLAADRTVEQRQAMVKEIDGLRVERARVVRDLATLEDEIASIMARVQDAPVPRGDPKAITTTTTALKAQKDTIDQQIGALKTLAELRKVDVRALQVAAELETALTKELDKQGLSLEAQAKAQERLNALRRAGLLIAEAKPRSAPRSSDPASQAAKSITVNNKRDRDLLGMDKKKPEGLDDFEQAVADGIGNALASGIAAGFAQGLAEGGIGEGFKQMTAQMLAGLGDVFLQVGAKAILGSQLIANLAKGLASLNPALAIAAGVALLALASTMQARSGRGGGGSRSFGGFSSGSGLNGSETIFDPATRRATLPPGTRPSTTKAAQLAPMGPPIEVIGVQSARGQRLLGTSSKTYRTRGG